MSRFSQLKRYENSYRNFTGQQEGNGNMNLNDKRETKRMIRQNLYKPLNEREFLAKTTADIRQEFRRLPNPPARDPHAAK